MKKNALFLFLISIHIISCVDVIVSYDEQNDIIIYKQKIYMPKLDKSINQQIILNTNEDHLSEGQFWTYVFICICIIDKLKISFDIFCWNDVWINRWLFIN